MGVCGKVLDTLDGYAGQGISYEVINNEADNITVTLQSILQTLLIGVVLAMAVLFLFFGDWKGSLVVGISMPLSVLLAVIVLNFIGYDMNVLTGTGLILAIGMIVDNSIVILESCSRYRAQGLSFQEAAAQGTSTMLMSILAGTLTTVVVYHQPGHGGHDVRSPAVDHHLDAAGLRSCAPLWWCRWLLPS